MPDQTLAIDGVKALLLEARSAWVKRHDLKYHWLTPQALSLYLRYVRNLTLVDRRMTPDLYTLAVAANQRTYFRRDPRIHWLEWDDEPGVRLARARRELEI